MLVVTETGLQLLQERRRARNEILARMFDDWPDQDREQFAGLFERFVRDYERAVPALIAESGLGTRQGGEK